MLNIASPIPLYLQLADILREAIAVGSYGENEKVPSETEMAKQYGIGRPTVRQATDVLVREGLLDRRRGSGTYVLPKTKPVDLFSLSGAGMAWQASDVTAQVEWLSMPTLVDSDEYLTGLSKAFHMQRVTYVENVPVLLETFYLHHQVFWQFDQVFDPQQSLSTQVKQAYYLSATCAEQNFKVMFPSRKLAEVMQVSNKVPLLHVGRKLHFGTMEGVIYCDIICRTDSFRFSQTIYAPRVDG